MSIATERGYPFVLLVRASDKGGASGEVEEEIETDEVEGEDIQKEAEHVAGGEDQIDEESSDEDDAEGEEEAEEQRGELDEGENNPEILRQFMSEVREHERAMDEDSSDDEVDEYVPMHWPTYDFSQLTVNQGQNISWEYRENEICIGDVYGHKDDLKDVVKRWSTLTVLRQFKVVRSSPSLYDICCLKNTCQFRLYAYKGKWKDYWEISRMVPHTCELEQLDANHRNLSADFVANYIYPYV